MISYASPGTNHACSLTYKSSPAQRNSLECVQRECARRTGRCRINAALFIPRPHRYYTTRHTARLCEAKPRHSQIDDQVLAVVCRSGRVGVHIRTTPMWTESPWDRDGHALLTRCALQRCLAAIATTPLATNNQPSMFVVGITLS